MHLSKENLNLYRIASTDGDRLALTGVHVNPAGKVTAASNGSMLVEVTMPADGSSGDKESQPFILPREVAERLAKDLGQGAKVQVGYDKGKPVLSLASGKKANPIPFNPLKAVYPDTQKESLWNGEHKPVTLTCDSAYLKDVLGAAAIGKTVRLTLFADRIRFESEPRDVAMAVGTPAPEIEGKAVSFNSEYFRQIQIAVLIGKSATLSLFNDRLRIESKKDDGQSARGVLMCWGKPAQEPKAQAAGQKAEMPSAEPALPKVEKPKAVPQPEPKSEPAEAVKNDPASRPVRHFRSWGRYSKPFVPKDGEAKPPTEKQRMLYTYLLRRHEEEITPEILESTDFVGKIEELKSGISYDRDFATWPQWMKLCYVLLEHKAEPLTVCEVLNGITDKKTASESIEAWSDKSEKPVDAPSKPKKVAAAKTVAA